MYLGNSTAEYMPSFMLCLIFIVFSVLAIIEVKKQGKARKKRNNGGNTTSEDYISRVLVYYSYECFLVEHYMKTREVETAALHRDFARALRRALIYAGVAKEVITEYEKRRVNRL